MVWPSPCYSSTRVRVSRYVTQSAGSTRAAQPRPRPSNGAAAAATSAVPAAWSDQHPAYPARQPARSWRRHQARPRTWAADPAAAAAPSARQWPRPCPPACSCAAAVAVHTQTRARPAAAAPVAEAAFAAVAGGYCMGGAAVADPARSRGGAALTSATSETVACCTTPYSATGVCGADVRGEPEGAGGVSAPRYSCAAGAAVAVAVAVAVGAGAGAGVTAAGAARVVVAAGAAAGGCGAAGAVVKKAEMASTHTDTHTRTRTHTEVHDVNNRQRIITCGRGRTSGCNAQRGVPVPASATARQWPVLRAVTV